MEAPNRHPSATKKSSSLRQLSALYRKPGAFVLTAVLIILGGLLAASYVLPQGVRINGDGYQVVYMNSGIAYFGKLKNTSGEYLVLDTPYTAQDVKPEGESKDVQTSTTLLKVSQQQYGPEEKLSLKSDQVLFWQNLRDDSKVVQAIKNAQ